MNEAQLQVLIDAAVQKAVADTTTQITTQFSDLLARSEKLRAAAARKSEELLGELKTAQGKAKADPAPKLSPADALRARLASTPHGVTIGREEASDPALYRIARAEATQRGQILTVSGDGSPEVMEARRVTLVGASVITREEARDPTKYRAARDAAQKAGKPLQIVDEIAPSGPTLQSERRSATDLGQSHSFRVLGDGNVALTRTEAADVRTYRAAKAAAQKAGVRVSIVGDDEVGA